MAPEALRIQKSLLSLLLALITLPAAMRDAVPGIWLQALPVHW
jgi:hypothetical protein